MWCQENIAKLERNLCQKLGNPIPTLKQEAILAVEKVKRRRSLKCQHSHGEGPAPSVNELATKQDADADKDKHAGQMARGGLAGAGDSGGGTVESDIPTLQPLSSGASTGLSTGVMGVSNAGGTNDTDPYHGGSGRGSPVSEGEKSDTASLPAGQTEVPCASIL